MVQTHVDQGLAWRAQGRLDLAARALEAAVEAGGDDPQIYQALGEVLMQLDPGERGVAYLDLADYTRASQRHPDQIVYDFNRGVVWLQLDQFARAIADFTAVLRRQPGQAAAMLNRGYAYWLQGDRIRAAVDLAKAAHLRATDQAGPSGPVAAGMACSPGELVVPWEAVPLRDGERVVVLEPATLLRVEEARGDRVRVTVAEDGRRLAGWVDTAYLAPVGRGPTVEEHRFVGLLHDTLRKNEYVGVQVARADAGGAAVVTVFEYGAGDHHVLARPQAQWQSVLASRSQRQAVQAFLVAQASRVMQLVTEPSSAAPGAPLRAAGLGLHTPPARRLALARQRSVELSARTQRHLMLVQQSDYPADRHVLIVAEPHFRLEGQRNVLRGLTAFFDDNRQLLQPGGTVFLAEGCPAGETVNVACLVAAEPRPDERLLARVLATSWLPAYVAYEWREQHGIPVIGCEDPVLYRLCARRHLENWERLERSGAPQPDPYSTIDALTGRSVAARNPTIARTLLEQLDKFACPILFVGNGHVGPTGEVPRVPVDARLAAELDAAERARLDGADLRGIADWLRARGVGFYLLQPRDVGVHDQAVVQRQLRRYFAVFRQQLAQAADAGRGVAAGSQREVTVVPWPEKGAELVLALRRDPAFFPFGPWGDRFFGPPSWPAFFDPWWPPFPPAVYDDDDDFPPLFPPDDEEAVPFAVLLFLDGVKDVVLGGIGFTVGIIAAAAPTPITTPLGILIAYGAGTTIGSGINKMLNALRDDPAPDVGTFEGLGLLASNANPVAGDLGKLVDYGLELAGAILGGQSSALAHGNLGPILGPASDIADALGDAESIIGHGQDAVGYIQQALDPLLGN